MAKNTGSNYRIGSVKSRSQLKTKSGQFIKRDTTTGRFLSVSNKRYKGVALEVDNR